MTKGDLPERLEFDGRVTVRIGPERGFLFDQRTGRIFSLSSTAAVATERLARGAPVAEAVEAVLAAFDADPATVRAALAQLIAELVQEGLASVDG